MVLLQQVDIQIKEFQIEKLKQEAVKENKNVFRAHLPSKE